jgi:hypothetical protein
MDIKLQDYQEIVGPGVNEELGILAGRVRGRRMQHINSTPVGGGVAEILTHMIPLFRELGLDVSWDVIKGDQAFINVTKAFHNRRLRERMGQNGHEHVKQNFLVTRHLKDYLFTMLALEHPGESIVYLN